MKDGLVTLLEVNSDSTQGPVQVGGLKAGLV